MFFFRLLFSLLSVGFIAASYVKPSKPDQAELPINMIVTEYVIVEPGGRETRSFERVGEKLHVSVGEITNEVVPHRDKSIVLRLMLDRRYRVVLFMAHFRAPPANLYDPLPVGNIKLRFLFTYTPSLRHKWDMGHTGVEFQRMYTPLSPLKPVREEYAVICKPGSVFPITLAVAAYRRTRTFRMLPISVDDRRWADRDARAVAMTQAVKSTTKPCDVHHSPPVLDRMGSPFVEVLLGKAVPHEIVEEHGHFARDGKHFFLFGYFRPHSRITRLVLSSTVSVEAEIHAPFYHRDVVEHDVFLLKAKSGVACEMHRVMDPSIFYRVIFKVLMTDLLNHEFTLMSYEQGEDFSGTAVDLYIPAWVKEGLPKEAAT